MGMQDEAAPACPRMTHATRLLPNLGRVAGRLDGLVDVIAFR